MQVSVASINPAIEKLYLNLFFFVRTVGFCRLIQHRKSCEFSLAQCATFDSIRELGL